ncbi:MAG: TerB family tellurite resistance protein [Burkholderiales bacterium]
MLRAIRRAFAAPPEESPSGQEQVQLAVAVLLHEARRADYAEANRESVAAEAALVEIFALERAHAAALLAQGREKAQQLTSLYAPLAAVKRVFSPEERLRLVEHLWRVAFAEGGLDPHEDHYVRKVAHLLYVPNTQAMLARNRARDA